MDTGQKFILLLIVNFVFLLVLTDNGYVSAFEKIVWMVILNILLLIIEGLIW